MEQLTKKNNKNLIKNFYKTQILESPINDQPFI